MQVIEQFELGVSEARLLLELCANENDSGSESLERDNALRRASVVLLVSHFESYLKSVVEEFIDNLDSAQLEARKIPRGLRELHTLPRMNKILECNDANQRTSLLKQLQPAMALWNDAAKPPSGTLKPEVLSREVTNADSKTIDAVFSLMGANSVCDGELDVVDEDGATAPVNIRLRLADIIKCRNDIAHGDVSRRPTEMDVNRYITFLIAFARRLEFRASSLARTACT
jgi:hypothetical protein